ncbi:sigma-70 family RNA polymerase sigma factor [Virgibacillus sp. AGTR]|uniref:sigma-70 family RNA polymerase sigma factor n=1 Tax=Virgibacillus TaxID=84406 RepID=UPI0019659612|nr:MULTISPECIES: sigma-70 family RNA polymerase sigma factor [Virgibacillus]MCC2252436.1 sigma-70 family RNA polymerase sigma factor [Virgibacillus sp. AGTR]QRZ18222.1 sigma-70 family RNA polymerase sigma factor [Virgibacillus sp. AGTR]WBX82096.1 sigma-70 family RNA polymerase sigma factor [Virgibacillus salarius]
MFNEKEILSESDTNEILLEELMGLYGDELKRIAYLYVNDISQSEDIVQEVFISCYKNFHRFNKKSSYKTWLYRITINKCKDYQRKWSFRNIVYKPVISTIKGLLTESIHEEVEKQEQSNELVRLIAQLPIKYKDVLILYYYKQMSLKEISTINGLKMNTVKSRLVRGRKLLKRELVERGIYDE